MPTQFSVADILSRFKRKSIIDILFLTGIVLIVLGIIAIYPCCVAQITWLAIKLIFFGIAILIYALIKFEFFSRNRPDLLRPEETQIQTQILSMLTDDMSEKNKIDVLKTLSQSVTRKRLGE